MQPYSKLTGRTPSKSVHINAACTVFSEGCTLLSIFVPALMELLDIRATKNHSQRCLKIVPLLLVSTSSLSNLLFSWKNEKSVVSLPPSCFLFNPKWVSNPTVEKDPIQWMRISESKNPFYLILINKITHPLKFIKKWLYVYKVSLSDI